MGWIWVELFVTAGGLVWGFFTGAHQGGILVAIGLAILAAGLSAVGVEGLWQGSAFLRTGVLEDHSLSAVFGFQGQTGWVGLDIILNRIFEASIGYVWGGLGGLGLFITWLGEQVFN